MKSLSHNHPVRQAHQRTTSMTTSRWRSTVVLMLVGGAAALRLGPEKVALEAVEAVARLRLNMPPVRESPGSSPGDRHYEHQGTIRVL